MSEQPVVKLRLHSGPPARLPRWGPRSAGDASPLTALLLPQIWPILHPTVHRTHGGGPALRSSRRSAGVPTARTVRRGVDLRGASPPSVRRRSFTTGCEAPVRSQAGFSLIELLVATGLLLIISTVVTSGLLQMTKSQRTIA